MFNNLNNMTMKKKVIFSVFGVALVAITALVGNWTVSSVSEGHELLLENVEALSNNEIDTPVGYSSIHFPCYKTIYYAGQMVTVEDGVSAICWANPNSNSLCHSHGCTKSCSNSF